MVLLAPHNDDEVLFASGILEEFRPTVVIVTDAIRHSERLGNPDFWLTRRMESCKAVQMYDLPIIFLGIPDTELNATRFWNRMRLRVPWGTLIAPDWYSANEDHNLIGETIYKNCPLSFFYPTYTKELETKPTLKVEIEYKPEGEHRQKKIQALECYETQWRMNKAHFEAALKQSEYLCRADIKDE